MKPTIAIGIATAGRRAVMTRTVGHLFGQTRIADELLICPAHPEDFDPDCLLDYPGRAAIFHGPVGSSAQRNVLIDACTSDVIIFFDDDFLPDADYVAEVASFFDSYPQVAIATGKLLADDILGPGLDHAQGLRILAQAGPNLADFVRRPTYNGYGCNMAVRLRAVRTHGIRFDERLPLYAWLEDLDFSRQVAVHGEVVQYDRLRGVHLGSKGAGRSSGLRLGYSQIANPIYLVRKGTMGWTVACRHMTRNLIANAARSFAPEAWIDRRGRLRGNLAALWDWMRGRDDPGRILNI